MTFIDVFDEQPGQHREDQIRAGFADHEHDPIAWGTVQSIGTGDLEGYILTLPVMTDALTFDGVRIIGSYETAQWLADVAGVTLMTSWVAGLVSAQADAPHLCLTRARIGFCQCASPRPLVMDAKLAPLMTGAPGEVAGKTVGEGALAYDRHPALGPYCSRATHSICPCCGRRR